jgi:putative oxidoreductase
VESTIAQQRPRPIVIVRVAVSLLLGIHGFTRAVSGGVEGFGGFLGSLGLPAPLAIAWAITVFEMVGSILLALGVAARWLPIGFICILGAGIATVHGREGWFVVGGGRNGVEFSVLLISCLLAILYDAWRPRPPA